MTNFEKKLGGLLLPTWMSKGEPAKLLRAARRFWLAVYGWITWPINQFDPLTCSEPILRLIAWDRDITRFNGEPLSLFRRRVAYAFINAKDAGSVAGFIAIFDRLGIGYVELRERQDGIDWDVIILRVTDSQISANAELMLNIVRKYGRTCRRYQFEVFNAAVLSMHAGWIAAEYVCYSAPQVKTEITSGEYTVCPASKLKNNTATYGAKI